MLIKITHSFAQVQQILGDFERPKNESDGTAQGARLAGDRRQEIVFIGVDMDQVDSFSN